MMIVEKRKCVKSLILQYQGISRVAEKERRKERK